MTIPIIQTPRLLLRQWQPSDLEPFAQLNADTKVMQFFPNTLTEEQSNQMAEKIQGLIAENGYGFWAVELLSTSEFIGFVGLNQIKADTELAKELNMIDVPFLEIGWRLAKEHWGHGYATESAKAVLNFAFNKLNEDIVYAFTALPNIPSQKVMQRIGMTDTGIQFNHPNLADGHPLQPHCLYCMNRKQQ